MPWTTLVRRVARKIADDRCPGLAAQLAFYFFLALFPALLFLVALLGSLPLEHTLARALGGLEAVAPGELMTLLRGQLNAIEEGRKGGLLTLGIAGAIWSSAMAMVAIIDALNTAFVVPERRPWWKRRIVAILLTLALTVFTVAALALVFAGPDVTLRLAAAAGLRTSVDLLWTVLRWPLVVGLMIFAIDLVYHFAPNRRVPWAWVTPGSCLAMALWLLASLGFRLYVTQIGAYNATYGAIGGVIVVLLWFYLSGLSILVGAELNAVLEQARYAGAVRELPETGK